MSPCIDALALRGHRVLRVLSGLEAGSVDAPALEQRARQEHSRPAQNPRAIAAGPEAERQRPRDGQPLRRLQQLARRALGVGIADLAVTAFHHLGGDTLDDRAADCEAPRWAGV